MDLKKIFASGLVFVMMISKSSAIQCFDCSSASNTACFDIALHENELRHHSTIVPIVNCEAAVQTAVPVNFFCRKVVQTIFHPTSELEVRINRGCGWVPKYEWVPNHEECSRAVNSDHLATDCKCFSDHCNGSERVKFSVMVVLGGLVGYLFTR